MLFSTAADARAQKRDLVIHVFDGALQAPTLAPCVRLDRAHGGFRRLQVRLRGVYGRLLLGDDDPVRLLVQLGETISLTHAVVVVHQNAGNLPWHAWRNKRHMSVDVCVVRGDGAEHRLDPRDAEHDKNRQDHDAEHTSQQLPLPCSLSRLRRRGAGLRRRLGGFRVEGGRSLLVGGRLRGDRTLLVALLVHVGHPLQKE